MPIHIYEATTGNPVTVFVRPVSRLPWYCAMSCVRADSHYGRPEAMDWRERNRVAYIFYYNCQMLLYKASIFNKT